MTKIDLNQSPYFDDYNANKKFYKILFRPGRAVQARELTQIQTAIQTQIERIGAHLFQNGAQVLPGSKEGVKYISNNGYIKIDKTNFANDAQEIETNWMGKDIYSTSGNLNVRAKVIGYREADGIDEARLFLSYINADTTSGTQTAFFPGQTVTTDEIVPVSANVVSRNNAVGSTSSVIVEEGVYFFDSNFLLVEEQTVFIVPPDTENQDAWNNNPTATVGLRITESIVTADDDETILDNALGSPNFAAPGADRLHISADLLQSELNTEESGFISLLTVVEGEVRARVIRTEYSVIQDTLARRTFDESGDYTVNPFSIQIKDFLRTEINNGVYVEKEFHFETIEEAEQSSIQTFNQADPGYGVAHPNFPGKFIPGTSYNTIGDPTSFLQLCDDRLAIKIDAGKAYVKGYEIQKLGTSLVTLEKARTLRYRNNRTIATPLGTFFFVKNLSGVVTVENYDTVELHSDAIGTALISPGAQIGTARVLAIEFFSGIVGNPDALYRIFLFNIAMDANKDISQVRSMFSSNPTFTCDIDQQSFRLIGSVDKAANALVGTGTSWKNDEDQLLTTGDFVRVGQDATSRIYQVTADPVDDNNLSVTPNPIADTWIEGSTIDLLFSTLQNNSRNIGLVYKLPDQSVYAVRGGSQGNIDTSNNGIDTIYTSRRVVSPAAVAVGNQLQFNLSDPNEEFEDFNTFGYVIVRSTGDWLELLPYNSGSPAPGRAEVQALGNQLTVYLNAGDTTGTFYVIAAVVHSGNTASKERSKTLVKGDFTTTPGTYSGPSVVTTGSDVVEIFLGHADILRLTRIVESPDFSITPSALETLPAGHRDVTAIYLLDNGQRDYFYGLGKVMLKQGFTRPRGRIRVEFDYFNHGTTGNYFSVDSYPIKGPGKQINYEDILNFVASDGTEYDLTSSLDFRPRVLAGGIDAGFATTLELPKDNLRCDYHFFEGRVDKLYLDRTGDFVIKSGVPDVTPRRPEEPDTGMTIYELRLTPYTPFPISVFPEIRDNRRYTMRDIGKIEQRVKTLEYYTTLSLLEKDTSALTIQDADGNDRFKNGFLVDNFGSFGAADLGSADFKASLDRSSQICRPMIHQENVSLSEKVLLEPNIAQRQILRALAKYQKTGDIFTLPYTPIKMLEQTKASNVSNVNPYSVFTFVGAVTLNPWSDEWRDTVDAEPINIQDTSAFDAAQQTFGPIGTTIDYTTTVNNWTSLDVSTERDGQFLEVAGHVIVDKLPIKAREVAKKTGFVRVPAGYLNAGKLVPIGVSSMVAPRRRTTTTITGEQITTQFTSTFVDGGMSAPINMGTRIIDTALAEFIRSREVKFTAKGFMPAARLYAFFDGVEVSEDCKYEIAPNVYSAYGDPLQCDSKGRMEGIFLIPNINTAAKLKKFKVGDRVFRMTTSPTNQISPPPASAGDAQYTARGWIDTRQQTTFSTRLFSIARGSTTQAVGISQSDSVLNRGLAVPRDPIAQSFFVADNGGCFITAVDIFFRRRPTGLTQPPITLQLRLLGDEGGPSIHILPFGEVLKEADEVITNDINITQGSVTVTGYNGLDPKISPTTENSGPWTIGSKTFASGVPQAYGASPSDEMVPTRFYFESPIYLSQNTNYAIVLMSDSNEYETWVAQSGPAGATKLADTTFVPPGGVNVEIGTEKPILTDPYPQGIYFKSQNGISWSQDQTVDFKFALWKADFDIAVNGEMEFVNEEIALRELTLDPFETKNNSTRIRVTHPSHGNNSKAPKSRVVFSPSYDIFLTGTLTSSGANVTGTGTFFQTQVVVGSFIQHPITREQKKVIAIASQTSLTVDSAFSILPLASQNAVLATSYLVASGSALNGIDAAVIYNVAGFEIELAELDFYIIDLGVAANADGRVGGPGIFATENRRFEELMLLTTPLVLAGTDITWNVQTTQSAGINDTSSTPFSLMPRRTITPNSKIFFDNPMATCSYINESNSGDSPSGPSQVGTNGLGDKKSLNIRAVLKSTNRNLSPIIDASRFSAFLVSNRLDNPAGFLTASNSPEQIINDVFDDFVCLPTAVAPGVAALGSLIHFRNNTISNTTTIKTDNLLVATHLSKLDIGKMVTISGATGTRNFVNALVVDFSYTPFATVLDAELGGNPKVAEITLQYANTEAIGYEALNFTITQKDRFVDEIAPSGGSVSAKYVSKKLNVPRPSNSLRIMFDAYRDESCTIDLYYKLEPVNSPKDIDSINWIKAPFNLESRGALTPAIPNANRNSFEYSAYESSLKDLPSYINIQAKVVFRGGNPARPPTIKNFRLIALDE